MDQGAGRQHLYLLGLAAVMSWWVFGSKVLPGDLLERIEAQMHSRQVGSWVSLGTSCGQVIQASAMTMTLRAVPAVAQQNAMPQAIGSA